VNLSFLCVVLVYFFSLVKLNYIVIFELRFLFLFSI